MKYDIRILILIGLDTLSPGEKASPSYNFFMHIRRGLGFDSTLKPHLVTIINHLDATHCASIRMEIFMNNFCNDSKNSFLSAIAGNEHVFMDT